MKNYVKVKFVKGYGTAYTYTLPDMLKLEKLKVGDAIVVPVGHNNDLKVAYIHGTSNSCDVNPSIKLKEAFGLVRKL